MTSIDAVKVLTEVMLGCRNGALGMHGPLATAADLLAMIRESRTLVVEVDDAWLAQHHWVDNGRYRLGRRDVSERGPGLDLTEPGRARYLRMLEVAVAELDRLLHEQRWQTAKQLGYAMHNVPDFLSYPAAAGKGGSGPRTMDRQAWDELSIGMREAMTRSGTDLERVRSALRERAPPA